MNLDNNKYFKGVTCFVLNQEGKVLIEKRANKGINPGELDLCSGHVNDGETPTQAVIRELGEELGIKLEEAIGVKKISKDNLKLEIESCGKTINFLGTIYCLKRSSSDVIIQEEEIDKIAWFPLEDAFELIKNGKTRFPANYDYEPIFQKVREICYNRKINKEEER